MELVHEIREIELEISLKINEEMDGFYLDHPELAPKDDQQKMPYWHYQVAFQKRNALETFCPIIEKYYSQSKQKNLWLTHWWWISPAILFQHALNHQAGNAHEDFLQLQQEADKANLIWQDIFFNKIFRDELMNAHETARLPSFIGKSTMEDIFSKYAYTCSTNLLLPTRLKQLLFLYEEEGRVFWLLLEKRTIGGVSTHLSYKIMRKFREKDHIDCLKLDYFFTYLWWVYQ